jgi:monomeric isocitrate dehydrogenase
VEVGRMRSIKCTKNFGNTKIVIGGVISKEIYDSTNKVLEGYKVKYGDIYRICRIKEWDIELGGYIL